MVANDMSTWWFCSRSKGKGEGSKGGWGEKGTGESRGEGSFCGPGTRRSAAIEVVHEGREDKGLTVITLNSL